MLKFYGATRVSTKGQNIETQVRNILEKYPNAYIIKETYTGTIMKGNKESNFEKARKKDNNFSL